MLQPAIVVVTYNRLASLQSLLRSLSKAIYNGYEDIPLIISIDGGASGDVVKFIDTFIWKYGSKRVIKHSHNLGLRKHVISCGDLTSEYKSIILLEDDLLLSPNFYDYSVQAVNFYSNDKSIAGVSLYSYRLNENIYLPFEPLQDGNDVFFMQVPSSWGQIWNKDQWDSFKEFYNTSPSITIEDNLPSNVKNWPESSWKKYFYKYLIVYDRYFVYPQYSYSTNFGTSGHHLNFDINYLQVPLVNGIVNAPLKFIRFADGNVKYDAYYELLPECLYQYGVEIKTDCLIDLYGTKQLNLFKEEYVLSARKCLKPIQGFDVRLHPIVNNILMDLRGDIISLGKRKDFIDQMVDKTEILAATDSYVFTYTELFVKRSLPYKLGRYFLNPNLFLKKIKKAFKIFK